jgi:hypothetical protein
MDSVYLLPFILPFNRHINDEIIRYILPDIIETALLRLMKDSKYYYEKFNKHFMNNLRGGNVILSGSFLLFILGYTKEYNDIDLYVEKDVYPQQTMDISNLCEFMYDILMTIKHPKHYEQLSDLACNIGIDKEWLAISNHTVRYKDYYIKNGMTPILYEDDYKDYSFTMPYENTRLFSDGYWNANISKYIQSIREYNLHTTKLQILETRCDPQIIVDKFDYDFCKVYYSFKDRKVIYLNEFACKNKIHNGIINEEKTSEGRKGKYLSRGYRFL